MREYRRAVAHLRGSEQYPEITGEVRFREARGGVLVTAEVTGLPSDAPGGDGIFAFHIHEGTDCGGDGKMPFPDAGGHFAPRGGAHPYHAGDLPPLFGNHGYAYMSVFTDRFTPGEVIGRVVIIHRNPDDFTTQPSGNAGEMIACGEILPG